MHCRKYKIWDKLSVVMVCYGSVIFCSMKVNILCHKCLVKVERFYHKGLKVEKQPLFGLVYLCSALQCCSMLIK